MNDRVVWRCDSPECGAQWEVADYTTQGSVALCSVCWRASARVVSRRGTAVEQPIPLVKPVARDGAHADSVCCVCAQTIPIGAPFATLRGRIEHVGRGCVGALLAALDDERRAHRDVRDALAALCRATTACLGPCERGTEIERIPDGVCLTWRSVERMMISTATRNGIQVLAGDK